MALDGVFGQAAGLLLGDIAKAGGIDHEPVGTFFLLQVLNGRGIAGADVFMVTARHLIEQFDNIEALMRDVGGDPITWPVSEWALPSDPVIDIAVARWEYPEEANLPFRAIPSDDSYENFDPGAPPKAGVSVYFVGLLAPLRDLAMRGVPVVRTAAVSAWNESGVIWRDREPPFRQWRAEHAHLIDTRSFGGFSGGPALLQHTFPGPREKPMPESWAMRTKKAGNDPNAMGDIHTMTMWCGMFTAFIDETGIGVVVRSADIMEFIENSPKVQVMREKNGTENETKTPNQGR